jgi:hypothetical protein
MKKNLKFLAYPIMAGLLCFVPVAGQQKKITETTKKKEQVEKSYKKAYARARRLTLKHRREIQTKATRARMDEAFKRADKYNKANDPSWIDRLFKRKRPKKH